MRTVREWLEELRQLGPEKLTEQVPTPVLIELPVRPPGGDEADLLDRPLEGPLMRATIEATEALKPRPLVINGDATVHFVSKRPGGAFRDRIGIGRTRNNDIMLAYPRVSKYHAFFRHDAGIWTLSDAGSRNGTFAGAERLAEGEARPLDDGAEIRIGPYPFLFYTPAAFLAFLGRRLRSAP